MRSKIRLNPLPDLHSAGSSAGLPVTGIRFFRQWLGVFFFTVLVLNKQIFPAGGLPVRPALIKSLMHEPGIIPLRKPQPAERRHV